MALGQGKVQENAMSKLLISGYLKAMREVVEKHKAEQTDTPTRVLCADCAGEGCELCDGTGYVDDLGISTEE
jgi:hypothetical protein